MSEMQKHLSLVTDFLKTAQMLAIQLEYLEHEKFNIKSSIC